MVSPTSARTTSGEKVWPPFPAAIVCVTGTLELVAFAEFVESAEYELDVADEAT